MLEGGEDPRFIARRMVILASEDVGNADPQALSVATAAAAAVDRVGLPEAQFALAQAADLPVARAEVRRGASARSAPRAASCATHGAEPPPVQLRSGGRGEGYDSPHRHPGHLGDAGGRAARRRSASASTCPTRQEAALARAARGDPQSARARALRARAHGDRRSADARTRRVLPEEAAPMILCSTAALPM